MAFQGIQVADNFQYTVYLFTEYIKQNQPWWISDGTVSREWARINESGDTITVSNPRLNYIFIFDNRGYVLKNAASGATVVRSPWQFGIRVTTVFATCLDERAIHNLPIRGEIWSVLHKLASHIDYLLTQQRTI